MSEDLLDLIEDAPNEDIRKRLAQAFRLFEYDPPNEDDERVYRYAKRFVNDIARSSPPAFKARVLRWNRRENSDLISVHRTLRALQGRGPLRPDYLAKVPRVDDETVSTIHLMKEVEEDL